MEKFNWADTSKRQCTLVASFKVSLITRSVNNNDITNCILISPGKVRVGGISLDGILSYSLDKYYNSYLVRLTNNDTY